MRASHGVGKGGGRVWKARGPSEFVTPRRSPVDQQVFGCPATAAPDAEASDCGTLMATQSRETSSARFGIYDIQGTTQVSSMHMSISAHMLLKGKEIRLPVEVSPEDRKQPDFYESLSLVWWLCDAPDSQAEDSSGMAKLSNSAQRRTK